MGETGKRGRFFITPMNKNNSIDIHLHNVEKQYEEKNQSPTRMIPKFQAEQFKQEKQIPTYFTPDFSSELPERDLNRTPNHSESPMISTSVLNIFQDSLGQNFSGMMKTHRDILTQFLERDRLREENLVQIVCEITELTRKNASLAQENQDLRTLLSYRQSEN